MLIWTYSIFAQVTAMFVTTSMSVTSRQMSATQQQPTAKTPMARTSVNVWRVTTTQAEPPAMVSWPIMK